MAFTDSVMIAASKPDVYLGTEGKFVDLFALRILCLLICRDMVKDKAKLLY